jgi:C4-dicarboxylate transporter DctM subunit
MEYLQQDGFDLVLGWEFYVPLLIALVMIIFAVPVWAVLGVTSMSMLYFSEVLPLGLVGESLFDGIDAFALIAVPLFVLTGDVLVRTGLSDKLLNVAEALVGGFRSGFGTATVLVCGFFACISGSDAAGAAGVGRMTIGRLVEQG